MGATVKWTITIPDWHPAKLNQLLGDWRKRERLKKGDRFLVVFYVREHRVPVALGKRRVSLTITLAPRQRAADPDAYWKSLLDALVISGALTNDNRQVVELGPVEFVRGAKVSTTITLEDLDQ